MGKASLEFCNEIHRFTDMETTLMGHNNFQKFPRTKLQFASALFQFFAKLILFSFHFLSLSHAYECFSLASEPPELSKGTGSAQKTNIYVTASGDALPEGFRHESLVGEPVDLRPSTTVLEKQLALNAMIDSLIKGQDPESDFSKLFANFEDEAFSGRYIFSFEVQVLGQRKPSRVLGRILSISPNQSGTTVIRVQLAQSLAINRHALSEEDAAELFRLPEPSIHTVEIAISDLRSPIRVIPSQKESEKKQLEKIFEPKRNRNFYFTFLWDEGRNHSQQVDFSEPNWQRLEGRFVGNYNGRAVFYGRTVNSTEPLREFFISPKSIDLHSLSRMHPRARVLDNSYDDLRRSLKLQIEIARSKPTYLSLVRLENPKRMTAVRAKKSMVRGWLAGLYTEVDGSLSLEITEEFPLWPQEVPGTDSPNPVRIPIEDIVQETLTYEPGSSKKRSIETSSSVSIEAFVKGASGTLLKRLDLSATTVAFLKAGMAGEKFADSNLPMELTELLQNDFRMKFQIQTKEGRSHLIELRYNMDFGTSRIALILNQTKAAEDGNDNGSSPNGSTLLYSFAFVTHQMWPSSVGLWHKIQGEIRKAVANSQAKKTTESPRP